MSMNSTAAVHQLEVASNKQTLQKQQMRTFWWRPKNNWHRKEIWLLCQPLCCSMCWEIKCDADKPTWSFWPHLSTQSNDQFSQNQCNWEEHLMHQKTNHNFKAFWGWPLIFNHFCCQNLWCLWTQGAPHSTDTWNRPLISQHTIEKVNEKMLQISTSAIFDFLTCNWNQHKTRTTRNTLAVCFWTNNLQQKDNPNWLTRAVLQMPARVAIACCVLRLRVACCGVDEANIGNR